ncbi:restriction endonuclease PLD domain-containing protein [Pedobacter sp. Leaf250]|uniref:restriction endonuclease PLD domain-containing protein n=1 Tax=Pedobacter sp. Leaf250 TaxID=2876559 RepID=UPI001E4BF492|nr:restriction endonuclease PLD domain-containing protein [Pedobacter sp. Leaf250]
MARITLLTVQGTVHNTGGLNWGSNPENHTRPLDAYIPIHIATIRANPGLFPAKTPNQTIKTLTWDDGRVMQVLFEGNQEDSNTGVIYPKQISSTPEKNVLGSYLRSRLGVSPTHRITLADLQLYGRATIDIIQTGPDQYAVDFHP